MSDIETGFRTLAAVVRSVSAVDQPVETKIQSILAIAADSLSFPIAYFTAIDDRTQRIVASVGDHDSVSPGAVDPLEETYCRKTIDSDSPVVVTDAPAEGWADDPAFRQFGFRCYLGTTVAVGDETYGTLCFADKNSRPNVDSDVLETTVAVLAQIIGYEIAREQAAARIERRERRYRSLFEGSRDALLLLDQTGIRECNTAACELFEADSRDQLRGCDPGDLSPASQPDGTRSVSGFAEQFVAACSDGATLFTWEFQRCSGDTFHAELKLSRIELAEETLLYAHIRDVTDRRRWKRKLRLFRNAVEQAAHSVIITDKAGVIQYVNPAFESQTGYDRQEAIGRTPAILKSGKQSNAFYAALWETILDGDIWEADIINRRKSGELYQVHQEIAPIETNGEITHFVAIQSDVTTRRLREQQLGVLNRLLRHNIRNEINVISGQASLLADRAASDEVAPHVETIRRKAETLSAVSEKVGSVRSLLADDYPDDPRIDAGNVVTRVAETYDDRYPNVTVRTPATPNVAVTGDERLEVAIDELAENAVVHNDATEPVVTLKVAPEAHANQNWVDIIVADNGPGIPAHEQVMLESERETQLEHGSGLALWIVYWTASVFGGEVMIDDRSPRGARVTLRMPRAE